jgi:hypothetical protein
MASADPAIPASAATATTRRGRSRRREAPHRRMPSASITISSSGQKT